MCFFALSGTDISLPFSYSVMSSLFRVKSSLKCHIAAWVAVTASL